MPEEDHQGEDAKYHDPPGKGFLDGDVFSATAARRVTRNLAGSVVGLAVDAGVAFVGVDPQGVVSVFHAGIIAVGVVWASRFAPRRLGEDY